MTRGKSRGLKGCVVTTADGRFLVVQQYRSHVRAARAARKNGLKWTVYVGRPVTLRYIGAAVPQA